MKSNRVRNPLLGLLIAATSGIAVDVAQVSDCYAQSTAGVFSQPGDIPQFYFCKSREFSIPFNVAAMAATPTELQLEVSSDGGGRWSVAQRSTPGSKSFRYLAPADGLYLFRLVAVDETGRAVRPSEAPMQVIIDSAKPTGDLTIDIDEQGRMVADFLILEPNLDADSVRLEYRTERETEWVEVACALQTGEEPFEVRGHGNWDLPVSVHQLMVRLVARDQAGNELEVFRNPSLPRTAGRMSSMQLASQRLGTGLANQGPMIPPPNAGPTIQSVPSPRVLPSTVSSTDKPPANLARPSLPMNSTQGPMSPTQGNPIGKIGTIPMSPGPAGPTIDLKLGAAEPTRFAPSNIGADGKYVLTEIKPENVPEEIGLPSPSNTAASEDRMKQPDKGTSSEAFKLEGDAPEETVLGAIEASSEFAKMGISPYFTSSKAFSLDYSMDADPVIGIRSIELWGTIDAGRTWENWGEDPNRTSPMDVSVEDEGLFGFRIVVVSSNGITTNRPVSGDSADMWVYVDTGVPQARITSAKLGAGADVGSLVIEYEASDSYTVERPISFSVSDSVAGPWKTIAAGLPNTGRHSIKADPSLPAKAFLRLEVLDRAGNVGVHGLETPINFESLSPRGRIQGIRPIIK